MSSVWCVSLTSSSAAQDYDNGVEAYNTGDYQTALQEWRPLAEQGDASAQFVLL